MPRYRFHVFNDDHTIDEDGKEFADIDAARAYAVDCARGIMADELKSLGVIDLRHWIEIEDEEGDMHVLTFADAVTVNQRMASDPAGKERADRDE